MSGPFVRKFGVDLEDVKTPLDNFSSFYDFFVRDIDLYCPPVSIPGMYHASGPYSLRRLIPYYSSNFRMVTPVDSDHFGRTAMLEVGALSVGSIRQLFQPDSPVAKGAKKARFELGGSTVALLFEKGRMEIDPDLLAHTEEGIETYVRLVDSIGRVPASGGRGKEPA